MVKLPVVLETKHSISSDLSESVYKLANTENKESKATFEFHDGIEDLILSYISNENFNSERFNSSTHFTGRTLFEKRIPLITLLNHVVRGEYRSAENMLVHDPL